MVHVLPHTNIIRRIIDENNDLFDAWKPWGLLFGPLRYGPCIRLIRYYCSQKWSIKYALERVCLGRSNPDFPVLSAVQSPIKRCWRLSPSTQNYQSLRSCSHPDVCLSATDNATTIYFVLLPFTLRPTSDAPTWNAASCFNPFDVVSTSVLLLFWRDVA